MTTMTLAAAGLLALAAPASAVTIDIPVPNGDFEDWQSVGTSPFEWSSLGGSGLLPDEIGSNNDEFWSNPASYGSGWTQLTGRRTDGRWGLQHPNGTTHHERDAAVEFNGIANALSGPEFSGHFIGFANLDANDDAGDAVGPQDEFELQSAVLGQLQAGSYTATLDVGFRANAGWNDHAYEIALVADGVTADGNLGSTGGAVLGTPGTITLQQSLGAAGFGANQTTVSYTLNVPDGDALIGNDFALRIRVVNTGTVDGAPSTNGTDDFTQANFDNAIVQFSDVVALVGDTDGDGDIDDFDLLNAISNFTGSLAAGTGGKGIPEGDTDTDADVDDFDLLNMISGFTGSLSAPSSPAVPEPASIALLGLGGLLIARRRRSA